MECPECKQEFDESIRIPRILTSCGHTLCELCLKPRYKKKAIICPLCSVTTNAPALNLIPSNLALIQLKQKKSVQDQCTKHKKPIEAYCCNDSTLACVLCLVEDGHKSHDLCTIPKAVKKYKDQLNNYKSLSNSNQELIQKEISELNEKQYSLMLTYNKLIKDFLIIFEIIKNILIEKEAQIKEKLKKTLDDEVEVIKSRSGQLSGFLINIENFKQEVMVSDKETEIEFILHFPKREEMAKTVTAKLQSSNKTDPFNAFSVENEVNNIIRLVQDKFFQKPKSVSTPSIKKKQITGKEPLVKGKMQTKVSNKALPKPATNLDWNNISAISKAHSDEDTLSIKSFDFNSLYRLHGTKVYTISGFSDRALVDVELFDSNTGLWSPLPSCLTARTQFSALNYQGDVLVLGGKQSGKRINSCEKFSLQANTWLPSPITLPSTKSGFASLCLSNDIYIIGGNDGSVLNTFETFNQNEWISLPNMINKRDELAAVVGPDLNIYAIGGYGGDALVLDSAEMYNIETKKWELIPCMTCPRRALSVVSLPDGIYAIGGYNGSSYLKEVEKYDVRMKKWVALASMKHPRCTLSCVASGDCQFIYAIGGFNGSALNVVERYSVADNRWEDVAPLKNARFMHCSVAFND